MLAGLVLAGLTRPGQALRNEWLAGRKMVAVDDLGSSLVFRNAQLTLPEHMVLMAYALSVRAVALTVTVPIALLGSLSAPTFWQTSVFWGVWYVYFGWAASQFYAGARWRTGLLGAMVAAIGHALIIGFLILGSAIYEAMKRS